MINKLLLLAFLFTATFLNAQSNYEILEQDVPFNKMATSFTTNVIGVGEGLALRNWQKFIEKHKGTTYVVEYGEGDIDLVSDHVEFPLLDNKQVLIHSRFAPNDTETGVLITIWIEMEDGTFYSSKKDPIAGKNIKKWLLDFHNELMTLNRTH